MDFDDFLTIGFLFLLLVAAFATLSNPYAPINRVRSPFSTRYHRGRIDLYENFNLTARKGFIWQWLAFLKCAWHIVANVRAGKKSDGVNVEEIVRDIVDTRFDPDKPYLITGNHFSVLYPRNLGVFYYSVLDPRTAFNKDEWVNRQRLYVQSVAYALASFESNGECSTTIVPVGRDSVACVDIYSYPSDALFGILYALSALKDNAFLFTHFDFPSSRHYPLMTQKATGELIERYRVLITKLVTQYVSHVFDHESGLIKKGIHISSAKDSVVRSSAFYDNVVFWKTLSLARALGIDCGSEIDLAGLRERILVTFWIERKGHFLEDLSEDSVKNQNYSADWLVAFFTQFLDPRNEHDRRYLDRSVRYTIESNLDMPFPLRYQESNRYVQLVSLVSLAVPSYGGKGIWSFWGAEFIKLLIVLSNYEEDTSYLARAGMHIDSYDANMLKYGGYPEIYANNGKMLRSLLYQSVRTTGWVVGFEQAKEMYRAALVRARVVRD